MIRTAGPRLGVCTGHDDSQIEAIELADLLDKAERFSKVRACIEKDDLGAGVGADGEIY